MEKEKNLNWFVIKTRSRAEDKVFQRINALGMHAYLPLQKTIRQWSDRKKKIEIPLIPSTLFVETDLKSLNQIYTIPGFYSILKFLGKPALVRQDEINNLKLLLQDNIEIEKEDFFEIWTGSTISKFRKNLLEGNRCDKPCTECNAEGTVLGKNHASAWKKIYKKNI